MNKGDGGMEKYLVGEKEHLGGIAKRYRFPNDYGASVVSHPYSYGGSVGKWELAVLEYSGEDWRLTYSTPITQDVLGYLTDEDVLSYLKKIKKLKGEQ